MAHELANETGESRYILKTVGLAVKSAVFHPVPLPILIGLIYAQTGWGLHPIIDKPLQLLGTAFGPVALVLVGITLSQTPIGQHVKGALKLSVVKTFVHPFLMAALGYAMGMRGIHLTVMVVAAALPIGANVFLFSQRYQKEEDVVTAAVAVSTVFAIVSVSLVMALLPLLPA
jgi:predicted permease